MRNVRWTTALMTCAATLAAFLGAQTSIMSSTASAQTHPDFSGVWSVDVSRSSARAYGQVRVVTQTPDVVQMVAIQRSSPFRDSWVASGAKYVPEFDIVPWKFRLNRFGPRRGGDTSHEPLTQARWEGDSLVAFKQIEAHSFVWIWTLVDERHMLAESFDRVSPQFDFKRASLGGRQPTSQHVYTKVPTSDLCDTCDLVVDASGLHPATADARGVTFRLSTAAAAMATCRDSSCQLIGTGTQRIIGGGETVSLSLDPDVGQWAIRLAP